MDMPISRFTDARHLTIVSCTNLVGYRPKCRAGVDPGFGKRDFLNGSWNGIPLSELVQKRKSRPAGWDTKSFGRWWSSEI